MTAPAETTPAGPDFPVYWTVRAFGEPVPAWAERMARTYASAHPGTLARLAGTERADTRSHLACAVSDLGGQDPYPHYGADENDMDPEVCDD